MVVAGGTVNLDVLEVNRDEGGGAGGLTSNTVTRDSAQWRAAVYARLGTAAKTVSEIQSLEMVKFTEIDRRLRRMEALLKSVANSPGRTIGRTNRGTAIRVGTAAQGGDSRPATLCRNPRTLSILWSEYMNGIGGRKPAQQFTREERGLRCVKQNYYFRKPFWTAMQRLVDKGYTESVAIGKIEKVYEKYGSITNILRKMLIDERNGGHRHVSPKLLY